MNEINHLKNISALLRYYIIASTTAAGSGHPSSSLSAVELMGTLLFSGVFRFDSEKADYANNDRLVFSKGHASPLLYALWTAAGKLSEEELMTLRQIGSRLEGHPTYLFEYAEAATGSLGQGLSIGAGMALNAKLDDLSYKTYVLLGDSEMSEGSQWEAAALASHYKLDNLIAVLDVNGLGQRGRTMYDRDLTEYDKKFRAFNWNTIVLEDGHDIGEILQAYPRALANKNSPTAIIAATLKGKGISFMEDKDGWHGKAVPQDMFDEALKQIGKVDKNIIADISKPIEAVPRKHLPKNTALSVGKEKISTRKAYGIGLVNAYKDFSNIVVLDAEVSNSTFSEIFKKEYPDLFFEMYVAEQNMVSMALGLSLRGKIPFVSSFAAFLSRAFDQIRMSQYSNSNIKFCGSHAGVSIGEDGSSQMGLEDIAMFRSVQNCVVLYPSDAISTISLVRAAAAYDGNVYIRTTRMDTPIIYNEKEPFKIGGFKTLRKSNKDRVCIIAAGITLFEALSSQSDLLKKGIHARVIDLYSIKPIDKQELILEVEDMEYVVTVEDHYAAGGLGEAVKSVLAEQRIPVHSLSVSKIPRSGKPYELLAYCNISRKDITQLIENRFKGM